MTMKVTENALNILTAKTYRGIGRAWIVKNLVGGESTERLVALLNKSVKEDKLLTQSDFDLSRSRISEALAASIAYFDGAVAIGDKHFPSYRGNVKNSDQPVVLFYRGDLGLLSRFSKNAAVIGLLNPDAGTGTIEEELVSKLVAYDVAIVSGLALGCDTIAHRQALRSKGKTVAILPGPLNDVLPSANKLLADEIVQAGGLLVTEYYEKSKSKMELSGRYQERDRLQALFSDCVVLAASYAKNDLGMDSGSRLAMEYAAQYGISRAVLYDAQKDGGNNKYDLNRQLIREDAELVVINLQNMDISVENLVSTQFQKPARSNAQADLFG